MQAYLYNIISEQQLKEILECLYSCLNLPIQALDEAAPPPRRSIPLPES